MTTTQYTPGPWEDNGNGLIFGQCSGDDDEAPFVADVCSNPNTYTDQEQANARLIAAAPDLLRVLEAMLEVFVDSDHYADFEVLEAVKAARTAIAKAEAA